MMGVTSMEMVCEGLVKAGMDPQMPAAILQEGTSAVQRRVVATVSDLPQKAREANIQAPSVLIVGKVCALEKTLSWTQNRPLDGVRVVLTRPKELVSRMAHRLYELGAEVIELPAICLEPYEENPQLEQAISHISDYQWRPSPASPGCAFSLTFCASAAATCALFLTCALPPSGRAPQKSWNSMASSPT